VRPRELSSSTSLFKARTPTLAPATHTNSYALGGRDVLLVEPATPYEDEQRAWIDWARGLAGQGRRPVAIFATHYHEDHIGGVDRLARELGLPLWAHDETARRIGPDKVARRLVDGDEIVLDGAVPQRWRVLETPGHAWGHLCLWEASERTLVVGDMVASRGTIIVAPGDGDMRLYIEQLRRLLGQGARLVLPAHGEPIDDPTELFERYIAHRLVREAQVLAAVVAAGPAGGTDAELVPVAYADTPVTAWPFARLSLQAHLIKLVEDGAVVRTGARYATPTRR
jgi:ribonuclease/clavin/mitogillin